MDFKVGTQNFLTRRVIIFLIVMSVLMISSITTTKADYPIKDGNIFIYDMKLNNVGLNETELLSIGLDEANEIKFNLIDFDNQASNISWGKIGNFSITQMLFANVSIDESKLDPFGGFYLYENTIEYLRSLPQEETAKQFNTQFSNITKTVTEKFTAKSVGESFRFTVEYLEIYSNPQEPELSRYQYKLVLTWDESNLLKEIRMDFTFKSQLRLYPFEQLGAEIKSYAFRESVNSVTFPLVFFDVYFISSDTDEGRNIETILLFVFFVLFALIISTLIVPYEPLVNGTKPIFNKFNELLSKLYGSSVVGLSIRITAPIMMIYIWSGSLTPSITAIVQGGGYSIPFVNLVFRSILLSVLTLHLGLYLKYKLSALEPADGNKLLGYALIITFAGLFRSVLWYYGVNTFPPFPNRIYDVIANITYILFLSTIARSFNHRLLDETKSIPRVTTTRGFNYLSFFSVFIFIPNLFLLILDSTRFIAGLVSFFTIIVLAVYIILAIAFFQMIFIIISFIKFPSFFGVLLSKEDAEKYPVNIIE